MDPNLDGFFWLKNVDQDLTLQGMKLQCFWIKDHPLILTMNFISK